MTDYGQDLSFGLFPTPAAKDPAALLELVGLAEQWGLDHVSIQDHPYHAGFFDTWTLLSVIGARTTSVHISTNVASLPLRPPIVLAKSAATLDILTNGRVELGLGAGASWDALASAGVARRDPREAVDALAEAVEIIRAFWSGRSLTYDGRYYQARGLHTGPAPAHPIPIWLGAYQPRMLGLTGRTADAWVPSLSYAPPTALTDMSVRIDEAAAAADRPLTAIRRIYNIRGTFGSGAGLLEGAPADWAEQLAGIALEHGMDTFILGTDEADQLRQFAAEVIPAVREHVALARGGSHDL